MTTTSPVNQSLEDIITSWRNMEVNPWLMQTLPRYEVSSVKNKPSVSILGVTTSRATSGGWRKDRSTSGQRGNKFNSSYRDISVIVAENNSVIKPKYQQYTSLNKMLSNFSKVLMAHISFTAVINNGGIGKGIGGIRKGTKKNYIYVL